MVKVFLVEDEIIMRGDIKNNISQEKERLEFAEEANDGELAYPLIGKAQPGILITDIRVSLMDGLELSEPAKKEFPRIKITTLSGYNKSDYARQAIYIGVTGYLLKPITVAKLLEAAKKAMDVIEKEREDARLVDKYHLEVVENMVLERQRLLRDLVTRWVSFKEALERGEQVGMDLSASFYQLMLSKLIPIGFTVTYSDRVISCQEATEERMESRQHVLASGRGDEGQAFILAGEFEREMERRMRRCAASLGELTRACKDIQCFGGVGSYVNRLGDLRTSYLQVGRVLAARFLAEVNRIISYSQMDGMIHGFGKTIDIHSVNTSKVNRKTLENSLKQGTAGEASEFVEEHFQNVGEKNCQSFMFRQYVVMDCYLYISTFLKQLGLDTGCFPWELSDMKKVLEDGYTLEVLKEKLTELFGEVMTLRDSQTASKYSQALGEARAFIHDNYAKEEVSLNTVVARTNTSPSYFSSIFSQEMGVTFVEYLTEVRVEEAEEPLICSNSKASEIGYEVGYKDFHYFGYLFKKTVGCMPEEYRAGSRGALWQGNGGSDPTGRSGTETVSWSVCLWKSA